jgi:hypothetical protein
MHQFLLILRLPGPEDQPLPPDRMAELSASCAAMEKNGVSVAKARLHPSAKGARIRNSRDKVTVVDGPFTEAKEVIAGFNLIQAASKSEAVEIAKQLMKLAGDGEIEVRQVYGPEDYAAEPR